MVGVRGAPGRRSLADHPARTVVAGFLATIALGTGLLLLPASTASGSSTSPLDALFTATSAVSVTGLTVVDTGTHWSAFGQAVLLVLIEVGGLGYMTVSSLVVMLLSRKLGLRRQLLARTEREALSLGDVRRVLVSLALVTMVVQGVVAALVTARLWAVGDVAFGTAAWSGLFHAVAAFNNAGFSLYEDSLVGFSSDWMVLVPIMVAIVVGGLGFPVLLDLRQVGRDVRRLTLHSKVTLAGSAGLLVLGFAVLTPLEWTNPDTLGSMPVSDRLLNGAFASVSPRTAGFNTVDVGAMREESLLATVVLMFIGAGSAGTSGGIKISTFMILTLVIWSQLRGERDVTGFHRRIPGETQRRAITVATLAVGLVVLAAGVLVSSGGVPFGPGVFEAVSAFGTVGLSTGITPSLPTLDRFVVIALMLVGRVGPITLGAALVLRSRPRRYRLPEEGPLIG